MKLTKSLMFFVAFLMLAIVPVVRSQKAERVWVIIGGGLDLKCNKTGCDSPDAYWTGKNKVFVKGWPLGWSNNWKDAKQYRDGGPDDPNYDIPNGKHCCYAEYPTPINSLTGKVSW